MASADSPFRGYKSIERIVARMRPLAATLRRYRPTCTQITLARADLDLLQRWPKAARLFQIYQREDGSVHWEEFTLHGDSSAPRYNKGSDSHGQQAEI